jgi:uracil-DNA glycosylase
MKQKTIETHKIGLVGQAPSRRGDPRRPLAGPNGQKIARLAGMSYDELIACRRKHLNTHYTPKHDKGKAFDHAKGNVNAADVLLDWRVERIVLLGKNVARCFGLRDLPFLAEIRIYGRRFLIFPHPSGANRWWNERRNERRAQELLQQFLRGENLPGGARRSGRSTRTQSRTTSTGTSGNGSRATVSKRKRSRYSRELPPSNNSRR